VFFAVIGVLFAAFQAFSIWQVVCARLFPLRSLPLIKQK